MPVYVAGIRASSSYRSIHTFVDAREKWGPLPKSSRTPPTSTPGPDTKVVRTSGEIFSDGSVIELVSSATDRRLSLLLWRKRQQTIARHVKHRGRIYEAIDVNELLRVAIRFPTDAAPYGTAHQFFSGVRDVFTRYIGLALPEASLLTAWTWSTWFPELASSPPTLVISGPDANHAVTLFRLLNCLCRRPLVLADINRSGLFAAMQLHPTLLVNNPAQFPKIWQLLVNANHHGVYVLGTQGKVHNIVGSRAFFVGMQDIGSEGALHLALPPAGAEIPILDERRQAEIARRFQRQWLMFRLQNLRQVGQSPSSVSQPDSPNFESTHNFARFLQQAPDIARAVAPLLQRQHEDATVQHACDVVRAIVEVLWAPLHQKAEIAVARIAELTNALIRSRGEILEFNAAEVGWKLKNLGFYRHRNGSGKVLQPSRETVLLVHQLARRLCLNLAPLQSCPDCTEPGAVVAK